MQLQGQTVKHKLFGNGVVDGFSNEIITVKFAQGSKRFIYPDAFTRFLTLENAAHGYYQNLKKIGMETKTKKCVRS